MSGWEDIPGLQHSILTEVEEREWLGNCGTNLNIKKCKSDSR